MKPKQPKSNNPFAEKIDFDQISDLPSKYPRIDLSENL